MELPQHCKQLVQSVLTRAKNLSEGMQTTIQNISGFWLGSTQQKPTGDALREKRRHHSDEAVNKNEKRIIHTSFTQVRRQWEVTGVNCRRRGQYPEHSDSFSSFTCSWLGHKWQKHRRRRGRRRCVFMERARDLSTIYFKLVSDPSKKEASTITEMLVCSKTEPWENIWWKPDG